MGSALSAPTMIAMLDGCKSSTSGNTNFAFDADLKALVAEIADVIIPKTDTPGAKEAGVGAFIEIALKDCFSANQQNSFVEGLKKVEEEAEKAGGKFASLANDKKISVLKTMEAIAKSESEVKEKKAKQIDSESGLEKKENSKEEVISPFFNLAKELTLMGYFTSEIGATQALEHVPVPGRFDACMTIDPKTQKAYSL
jgi:hypothetical protein